MLRGDLRKRISEHSKRVIHHNDCEKRLLDARVILMHKEHLRHLRNYDSEVFQLKQEIKDFNTAKRESTSAKRGKVKLRNGSELHRDQLPTSSSSNYVDDTGKHWDNTSLSLLSVPTKDGLANNQESASLLLQVSQTSLQRHQSFTRNNNESGCGRNQSMLPTKLDKTDQHLPMLPKHLQRYDHRLRPDDHHLNGTFRNSRTAKPLSTHSVAWLSFWERQTAMNSFYAHDDDPTSSSNEPKDSNTDTTKSTSVYETGDHQPNILSSSVNTHPVIESKMSYRNNLLSYFSLNRVNPAGPIKNEQYLIDMTKRSSKIRFGQGRHIAARIERRRLQRDWTLNVLSCSVSTE